MLPSTGSFYEYKCPFFNGGTGQCSRPYCHFRHVKKDSDESNEDGNSTQSEIPSFPQDGENHKLLAGLDSLLPNSSAQASAVAEAETKAESEAAQSNSKSTSQISYAPAVPPPTYKPTPISVLKSAHLPIPYTPLVVSRTPTAKKSKSRVEYVPHSIGGRPYFPPYSPAARVGTQPTSTPPRINNTLYEIYGPDGAQFSPNDAEPSGTGYSYASVDYNPKDLDGTVSHGAPKKPEPDPTFSPPDSPPPSPPSSESPIPSPLTADLDLSELDKLELEYESSADGASRPPSRQEEENGPSSPEKRKRSDSVSGSSSKKLKSSHSEKQKNGHTESEKKSSRSEEKRSSSSKSHKSSSSSSHRRSSSSSDRKDRHRDKHSTRDRSRHKKEESKEKSSKDKGSDRHKERSSSSRSSSSKDKSRSKESEKERDRHRSKDSDDKHSRRSSSSSSNNTSSKKSESKNKYILPEEDEDLLRKVEADLDADLEDADFIEQQCLELFSEYDESTKISESAQKEDPRVSVENADTAVATISTKKRIAHSNVSNVQVPTVKPPSAPKANPHSIMKERFEKVAQSRSTVLVPKPYSATNPAPLTTTIAPAKKKIHSVPNVAMLLKPPCIPTLASSAGASRSLNNEQQRVDEFGRLVKVRLAHAPAPVAARKPVVDPSDCRKFKASTRQAYATKLHEAYINAGFGEASHDMALDAERSCAQGTESIGVYSHRIIQILKDLRACAESSRMDIKMDGLSGLANRVVSHNAMLAGKRGANVSWSIEKAKKLADVTENPLSLYDSLLMYSLSKEQLAEHGFPIASEEKGVALLKKRTFRAVDQPSAENERICVRCLKHYTVNKHGEQIKDEECLYHWGRRITVRRFREAETKYTCCDTADQGCCVGSCHVYEPNEDRRGGFMSTLSKSEEDPGVYALDCEMCYTTGGLELTRVTVVKPDLSVAYETLVKPKNRILDYNTRYSGLTEEDMKNAKTTLLQVQATLLGMFSDRTILIGHSLESDMKALKLVHPTIVDTSVVFPHKMGLPYKKALRTLAGDHLKKIIQNDVGGHDSKEDAVTAMELMIWKLKEDAKTR